MPNLPKSEVTVEREKIRQELAKANELLAQLRVEIRVLEDRRGEIRRGIEAETEELKRKRERELDEVVAQADAAIVPLKAERQVINDEIAQLTRDKIKVESDLTGIQGEIVSQRDTLGLIIREVAQAKAEKETAEASATATSAQIASLQSQIRPLQEELAHLTNETRLVTTRRDDTDKELVALQTKYQSQRRDIELEMASLQRKRNDLATTLTAESSSLGQEREQLTKWAETLAKQDKIIRAREYKVAAAEQKIADNVGLLNL
jgi:chromosome segregation ATPase